MSLPTPLAPVTQFVIPEDQAVRERTDTAYFEPLRGLHLHPETKLYLGLVHYTDGVEGARKRIAAAQSVVSNFGIATECGVGRRDPATVPQLLEIHRDVLEASAR